METQRKDVKNLLYSTRQDLAYLQTSEVSDSNSTETCFKLLVVSFSFWNFVIYAPDYCGFLHAPVLTYVMLLSSPGRWQQATSRRSVSSDICRIDIQSPCMRQKRATLYVDACEPV